MKISRNLSLTIHLFFDHIVPPFLRDSYWFMFLPFKIVFGKKAEIFFSFKDRLPGMTKEEYLKIYSDVNDVLIERETDLNEECLKKIQENISGKTVLEVGCGRGFLAKLLSARYEVKAADIHVDESKNSENLIFLEADIDNLPFESKSFDTVICTHTLEHVLDFNVALSELRRVAKQRIIIVVPRQRPYRYTFDLHTRFFPYLNLFLALVGKEAGQGSIVGGDIFYIEDIN